jgi:phage tail tape-measure protein
MPGRASFDLAAHRTATTGTGTLTLGVVTPGWLTLTAVGAADGVEVSYTIRTGAAGSYKYEQGWGRQEHPHAEHRKVRPVPWRWSCGRRRTSAQPKHAVVVA